MLIQVQSPLRLLIRLKSDVNGLSFWIFARNRITLLNSSILLQQRFDITEVCMLRNTADDDLRRLTKRHRIFRKRGEREAEGVLVRAGIKDCTEPECELPRELLYEFIEGQPVDKERWQ